MGSGFGSDLGSGFGSETRWRRGKEEGTEGVAAGALREGGGEEIVGGSAGECSILLISTSTYDMKEGVNSLTEATFCLRFNKASKSLSRWKPNFLVS